MERGLYICFLFDRGVQTLDDFYINKNIKKEEH